MSKTTEILFTLFLSLKFTKTWNVTATEGMAVQSTPIKVFVPSYTFQDQRNVHINMVPQGKEGQERSKAKVNMNLPCPAQ
ncbi:hypothetical protein E2C01_059250 [Portunus trituberculatus]|uniref:Uncharacterized protein n=1 Tax=Portunus trituberculatus TaxID=210409 RepID=A0A5B7H212_PORTR|nr:hypothetical protein [Portunus trituberculatus]